MSIFDMFLGIKLDEDFTDTTWWADAVYRGLAQEGIEDQSLELESGDAAVSLDSGLI
jgi:hypothetical protein